MAMKRMNSKVYIKIKIKIEHYYQGKSTAHKAKHLLAPMYEFYRVTLLSLAPVFPSPKLQNAYVSVAGPRFKHRREFLYCKYKK